jgi:RNA 3'-terminal phosphate cyclase
MFVASMSLPSTPIVTVTTTTNRGQTPEEVAQRCVQKLISVSDSAPPEIRDQAWAYQAAMLHVVTAYMKEAVTNDRVTVYNALVEAGQPQLAAAIQKL